LADVHLSQQTVSTTVHENPTGQIRLGRNDDGFAMRLLCILTLFFALLLSAPSVNAVSNGLFDLTVTLNSDKPATWFDARQLSFTIVITNKGTEDKALNITYALSRVKDGSVIQASSGSALVLAHQSYTYPLKIATFETGQLQLSVAAGVVGPAIVVCEAQPSDQISLGFLVVPLGIASLPLTLLGFGLAIYGLRNEEDVWAICGALFATVGILMLVLFGQFWIEWFSSFFTYIA